MARITISEIPSVRADRTTAMMAIRLKAMTPPSSKFSCPESAINRRERERTHDPTAANYGRIPSRFNPVAGLKLTTVTILRGTYGSQRI